ncbi:hypothetical protein Zmor_012064 [Zophobas morio]|jgi:hypothetical protein|uniref:Uncharacterized protein n=1 Tax=Zophobas morio TaxID=2755281 RepID=A0AA38LZX4_9CUCU|nr:hypothetical protein Zmor_012064 [Zophobas morio]
MSFPVQQSIVLKPSTDSAIATDTPNVDINSELPNHGVQIQKGESNIVHEASPPSAIKIEDQDTKIKKEKRIMQQYFKLLHMKNSSKDELPYNCKQKLLYPRRNKNRLKRKIIITVSLVLFMVVSLLILAVLVLWKK